MLKNEKDTFINENDLLQVEKELESTSDYSNQDLIDALRDVEADLESIRLSSYYEADDDPPFLRESFLLSAVIVSCLHMNPEVQIPKLRLEVNLVRMSSANILALLDADDADDENNGYRRTALTITVRGLLNTLNRICNAFKEQVKIELR